MELEGSRRIHSTYGCDGAGFLDRVRPWRDLAGHQHSRRRWCRACRDPGVASNGPGKRRAHRCTRASRSRTATLARSAGSEALIISTKTKRPPVSRGRFAYTLLLALIRLWTPESFLV